MMLVFRKGSAADTQIYESGESIGAARRTAPIDIPVGSGSPARPTRDPLRTEPVGEGRPNSEKIGSGLRGYSPRQRVTCERETQEQSPGGRWAGVPLGGGFYRWTRPGRSGRGIGLGKCGMPASASGGSPGSWGSAAAFKPRGTPHPTSNGRPPANDPDGVGLSAVMWRFRSR
jgi:hypothetical protein